MNNTMVDCATGIDVVVTAWGSATTLLNAELFNNVVANQSSFGINLDVNGALSGSVVSVGNNALFGNATNYSGTAADAPGYVKQDCLLDDATTPPSLKAGSPCRQAGDSAHAPTHDDWDAPRSASPDIGAVQMP